ncbi:malvidin galactosylase UGT88C3-like [Aristolochia californica]|uniref:malvidin galactosylase UGT88C3-like n=1 Tax=Aristolochia californica TaxID=171875 RepID=UPI0035E2E74D
MKVGLVVLPVPGRGHLISTVEFAKQINQHNRFSITILTMAPPVPGMLTLPATFYESVASSGLDINFLDLPPVDPPKEPSLEAFTSLYIAGHATHVKDSILRLQSSIRVVALVVDLFATTMAEVGDELGIPTYLFFTSGAALLSLMLYLPTLDKKIESDFEDLEENLDVPGLGSFPPLVMPTPLMNRKNEGCKWFVEHGRRFRYMKGIIVNTFRDLEPATLEAIDEGQCLPDYPTPPVFPVGPILSLEDQDPSHPCITWLDTQPPRSVVFLCFGSMGALPEPQVKEVALGLERSAYRFLWSIRTRRSTNFTPLTDAILDEVLPEGFIDRTKERGLVWPRWVPQTAILSHEAIGGFVSHCGWNSTLESLWFGVPILAWPLAGEQRLNGFVLGRDIGVAEEVEMNYRGQTLVGAAEVERGARCLMGESEKGKRARDKATEVRAASRAAVGAGGSSSEAMTRLTEQFLALAP